MSGAVKVVFARMFKWSPDGHTVLSFGPGEAEVPPRCAEVAAQAGAIDQAAPQAQPKAPKKGKAAT